MAPKKYLAKSKKSSITSQNPYSTSSGGKTAPLGDRMFSPGHRGYETMILSQGNDALLDWSEDELVGLTEEKVKNINAVAEGMREQVKLGGAYARAVKSLNKSCEKQVEQFTEAASEVLDGNFSQWRNYNILRKKVDKVRNLYERETNRFELGYKLGTARQNKSLLLDEETHQKQLSGLYGGD